MVYMSIAEWLFRYLGEEITCTGRRKEKMIVPEQLLIALDCCLDDSNAQVQFAASIALYTLERPSFKVCAAF